VLICSEEIQTPPQRGLSHHEKELLALVIEHGLAREPGGNDFLDILRKADVATETEHRFGVGRCLCQPDDHVGREHPHHRRRRTHSAGARRVSGSVFDVTMRDSDPPECHRYPLPTSHPPAARLLAAPDPLMIAVSEE